MKLKQRKEILILRSNYCSAKKFGKRLWQLNRRISIVYWQFFFATLFLQEVF